LGVTEDELEPIALTDSPNVDLVRSIYADWERGDFSRTDWAHPEIEYVSVGGSEPGTFRGLTEFGKTWRDRVSAWEDIRGKAEGYRALDDERVLVFFSLTGRGRTSGLDLGELHRHYVAVFHIHENAVTRLIVYWDRDRALADLGLAPEGDTS
jgi:ketosteroid isomerase-like protein